MGVISVASGWSIDGHQAAGRQEEAMLEAVVRDGVAEALLVATTSETRREWTWAATRSVLTGSAGSGTGRLVRLKKWTARVG